MIKNKIIDKLVKKLIVNNFKKEDIFELIDINKCFNFFENYIYYLLLLSQKKYDDLKVKMCSTISSYLNYLVDTYKIKQLSITQFKQKSCISNYELYALGVKGYDGDKNFYFDLEENLYICLDNVKHLNYKGIINIKYNPNFLASKTNAKIINKNFNNIYVFEKSGITNIYLGKYKFLFNT